MSQLNLLYLLIFFCLLQKLIPLIMGHFPAGTSSNLAAHFAQFILKGIPPMTTTTRDRGAGEIF